MKCKLTKLVAIVLTATILLGFCIPIASANADKVESFVTRLYNIVLERNPDKGGLANWVGLLKNGTQTGESVAYGFFFSEEFSKRNVSNETFIDLLYKTLLDRDPDPAGKANWVNHLNSGMSREKAFLGFINSTEFIELCDVYGIVSRKDATSASTSTVPKDGGKKDGDSSGGGGSVPAPPAPPAPPTPPTPPPPPPPPPPGPELTPDSPLLNPDDSGGGAVNRLVWIMDLVDAADLTMVGYDKSEPSFSDVDENNPFFEAQFPPSQFPGAAEAVETALQNDVIAISESNDYKFYPERAATAAFAVVTAVRSLGFVYDDLQSCFDIANDVGIFKGNPTTTNLTADQANKILDAVAKIAAPVVIDPTAEQIFDISDEVVDLSAADFVISYSFDPGSGLGTILLASGAALLVSAGDCIILPPDEDYPSGLAQKIISITTQVDETLLLSTETPALGEILGEDGVNIQGHFEADIDNFIVNPNLQNELGPDWNITNELGNGIMSAGFSPLSITPSSSAPFDLKIKTGWEDGRQFIDVELSTSGDDFVFLSSKIFEPTLDAKVDLEYWGLWGVDMVPVGVNHFYMAVNSKAEFSAGAEVQLFEKEFLLGKFPIPLGQPALTATINVYLTFTVEGKVSINYSIDSTVGIEYVNKNWRTVNKATTDTTIELEVDAKVGLKGQTSLDLFGLGLADMDARVGVGANGKLTAREVEPHLCLDVKAYLYLNINALQKGIISDLLNMKLTLEIWDKNNSPLKKAWHFEGSPLCLVGKCTYDGSSPGGGGGTPGPDWPGSLPGGDSTTNMSFESGFNMWASVGDARSIGSLGVLSPKHGSRMAILGTGFGAVNESDSRLARTFSVPAGSKSLLLDYNFVSEEPMQFVDSIFDDTLIISVVVNGVEHEVKRETVNTSQWLCIGCNKAMPKNSQIECHVGSAYDYFPDGKDSTYHTGWATLSIDVSAYSAFTLVVRVFDQGDSIYDSAVLVDNLRFTGGVTPTAMSAETMYIAVDDMGLLAYNTDALMELVAFVKAIDTAPYAIESVRILADAISRAEITLADPAATQRNVDVMVAALHAVLDELGIVFNGNASNGSEINVESEPDIIETLDTDDED